MGREIEHKYIVKDNSFRELAVKSYKIEQGYLSKVKERTVRVRLRDNQGFLTVKGCTEVDTRLEFEYEIPQEDARELLEMCEKPILRKERFIVPFGGLIWEVDEFAPPLAPLIVAEVELPKSRHDYPLPPFVGEEVTHDARYFNSNLLNHFRSDR